MSDLYDFIKSELDSKERTFAWLADKTGMSRQGLKSALINGSVRIDVMMNIAEIINVPVVDLLWTNTGQGIKRVADNKETKDEFNEFKKENKSLKKRVRELEEQVRDKNTIVSLMTEKKGFMTNLIFYFIDSFINNTDNIESVESLKSDLEKAPIDYLDQKKVWEYINKRIEEKKLEKE